MENAGDHPKAISGATIPGGIRTRTFPLVKQVLYPLSYKSTTVGDILTSSAAILPPTR